MEDRKSRDTEAIFVSRALVGVTILFLLASTAVAQITRPAKRKTPVVTIDGVLFKSNGKPRQYMQLQLVPIDSDKIINDSRLIAVADWKGYFAFRDVPEGRYTLSVKFGDKPTELSPYSTFFFPGTENRKKAEIFEILPEKVRKGLTFKLAPELIKRRLTGHVVWADTGKPAVGAWIGCVDLDFDFAIMFGQYKSGPDGGFVIEAYTGRRYQAAAIMVDMPPGNQPDWEIVNVVAGGETRPFSLDQATAPIEIKLQRSKELQRLLDKYTGVNQAFSFLSNEGV